MNIVPKVFQIVLPVFRAIENSVTDINEGICLRRKDVLGPLPAGDVVSMALVLQRTTKKNITLGPSPVACLYDTTVTDASDGALVETSDQWVSCQIESYPEVEGGCNLAIKKSPITGNQNHHFPRARISASHQLKSTLGSGCYDPFGSTVVPIDKTFGSYLTLFATSMWPAHPFTHGGGLFFKYFGSFLFENEAFFYATIASAAARRASRLRTFQSRQSEISREDQACLLYTTKSIAAVRHSLSCHEVLVVPDATIGVVAFLAMFEAVDPGNLELSATHMAAVQTLVRMRCRQTISWVWYERIIEADLKTACISLSRPRIPFPRDLSIEVVVKQNSLLEANVPTSPMLSSHIKKLVTPRLFTILIELWELSLFQKSSALHTSVFGYDTESIFKYRRLAVEHDLLEYMGSTSQLLITGFERCLHYSLLLFINVVMWGSFASTCAIIRVPAAHLRHELATLDLSCINHCDSSLRVMLWVHFIGAYTSNSDSERSWYTRRLGRFLVTSITVAIDEFRELLSKNLYAGETYDDKLASIYMESTVSQV
jgi:hypothetical protein